MLIKKIVVGSMAVNCYIAGDPDTKDVFIIDPGGDPKKIRSIVDKNGYKVRSIINTHGHVDHIAANGEFDYPVWIHRDDADFLVDANKNLSTLLGPGLTSPRAARLLSDGEVISAGNIHFEVIHTPGHTPGSICLKSDGVVFSGDTLFASGVGRTDFPYASQESLKRSLKEKLSKLEEGTLVYPGHGPSTTIGIEKKGNPYLS
jgi:glyoxylase-like metal-dependent hydrolase (beta-lactamase superfamily II)